MQVHSIIPSLKVYVKLHAVYSILIYGDLLYTIITVHGKYCSFLPRAYYKCFAHTPDIWHVDLQLLIYAQTINSNPTQYRTNKSTKNQHGQWTTFVCNLLKDGLIFNYDYKFNLMSKLLDVIPTSFIKKVSVYSWNYSVSLENNVFGSTLCKQC